MANELSGAPARGDTGRERPRIGIPLMLDLPLQDTHAPRFGMNRSYFDVIRRAGGIPVALVPGDAAEVLLHLEGDAAGPGLSPLDGLCLAGGGDPDPALYGQPRRPGCGDPDPERDAMEMALLRRTRDGSLPILAICRGIQILNVAWGGTLIQDIGRERPGAGEHYFTTGYARDHIAHEIEVEPGTRLREILGAPRHAVNSIHHQALDRIASGLRVTARAPDGIVEAVEPEGRGRPAEQPGRFLIGVQFHPEEVVAHEPIRRLFEAFVAAASAYRRARGGAA
ncbi:MAG: gamma-glutamyl-gamma-aminobutyrate hydrolase family protein [Candidatus Eisenbacteria bacterium]|uniref:Gamma-glutamyl-gamma-aminobutyrate hydrolase family protein n=1 Tax=Eiseniibacteriota bacterium TaxID=2212470 RepID=A0A937XE93_UNCEI|nr:gamma-glutamyl-gamma-aminobutyrate hydrolase family protein [Candidatus Eisenbacteria bacterium]